MKLFAMAALFIFSSLAYSSVPYLKCFEKAEASLEKKFGKNYDKNGFEATSCDLAKNEAAIVCSVAASKGGGDAVDTFRVVLDKKCNYVLKAEILFEE